MTLELTYWKNLAVLIYESYVDVDWDLLSEDIKAVKDEYNTYAAGEILVWGFADKSYESKIDRKVIQARLLSIQLNRGLFNMVPLSL